MSREEDHSNKYIPFEVQSGMKQLVICFFFYLHTKDGNQAYLGKRGQDRNSVGMGVGIGVSVGIILVLVAVVMVMHIRRRKIKAK